MVDQQCRESNGKAKIEGHMRVSDEKAHHCNQPRAEYGLAHKVTEGSAVAER